MYKGYGLPMGSHCYMVPDRRRYPSCLLPTPQPVDTQALYRRLQQAYASVQSAAGPPCPCSAGLR